MPDRATGQGVGRILSADAVAYNVQRQRQRQRQRQSSLAAGAAVIICSPSQVCLRPCEDELLSWPCHGPVAAATKAPARQCESPVSRSPLLESSLPEKARRCRGRQRPSGRTDDDDEDGQLGQDPHDVEKFLCRQQQGKERWTGRILGPLHHETCILPGARRARRRDRK